MYCERVIKIGILISESIVLKDTKFTESEVSRPNFAENIVVIAAVGALQDISEEISKVPLIPHIYITPSANNGKANSFKNIAKMHLIFLIPSLILLFAK